MHRFGWYELAGGAGISCVIRCMLLASVFISADGSKVSVASRYGGVILGRHCFVGEYITGWLLVSKCEHRCMDVPVLWDLGEESLDCLQWD